MIQHAEQQEEIWTLDQCKSEEDKNQEIAFLKQGLHDPLAYGAGLSRLATFGWRFMGTLCSHLLDPDYITFPYSHGVDCGRDLTLARTTSF
jgi:hypothetical protein